MKLPITDAIPALHTFGSRLALRVAGNGGVYASAKWLSLFLVLLPRAKRNSDLTGTVFSFSTYRHDNSLRDVFPLKGVVVKCVNLSREPDWLLVKLEEAFEYLGKTIEHVLIRRNDKEAIVPGKINQLVFFKMVPDISIIQEGENDKTDFPDEVWALCR